MHRHRGELVPIGEALADLPGPVQALRRDRAPQRGFTLADQVDQLVGASGTTCLSNRSPLPFRKPARLSAAQRKAIIQTKLQDYPVYIKPPVKPSASTTSSNSSRTSS